ncbi:MAG: hypothetical protein FIO02_12720 [Nitrosopumilales archaeon]|nr:hypothetical protein [Nitrosopumilales archaeon]
MADREIENHMLAFHIDFDLATGIFGSAAVTAAHESILGISDQVGTTAKMQQREHITQDKIMILHVQETL